MLRYNSNYFIMIIFFHIKLLLSLPGWPISQHISAYNFSRCTWVEIADVAEFDLVSNVTNCMLKAHLSEVSQDPPKWRLKCNDTSSYFFSFSELKKTLNEISRTDMTFYFLGDSTIKQQFIALACMIADNPSNVFVQNRKNDAIKISNSSISIVYRPLKRGPFLDHNFTKYTHDILYGTLLHAKPGDVILLNQGLHFSSQNVESSVRSLGNYYHVLKIMIDTYKEYMNYIKADFLMPFLIWRETVPQNFDTSNGNYKPGWCVPQKSCKCISSHRFISQNNRNWRNELANDLLSKTKIPISRVYKALDEATWDIHAMRRIGTIPPDCSHLSTDALVFLNYVLLSTVFPQIARPHWITKS